MKLTPRQYRHGYQVAAANVQIEMLAHGLLEATAAAVKNEPVTSSNESLSQNPSNDSRGQFVGWNHSADAGTKNKKRTTRTPWRRLVLQNKPRSIYEHSCNRV